MTDAPSLVLGISFGHGDSSAVIVKEGVLIAAAEEERFNRIKHFAGYPEQAIRFCLRRAGATAKEVDVVAIAKNPQTNRFRIASFMATHPRYALGKILRHRSGQDELGQRLTKQGFDPNVVQHFEHHLAHAASVRDQAEESEVAILTFDGLGDFVSTMMAMSQGPAIRPLHKIYFPRSLGYYYTAMTQFLGFPYFGDEFKVMGLSSLGEPRFVDRLARLLWPTKDGFACDHRYLPIADLAEGFYVENGQPYVRNIYAADALSELIGMAPRRAKGGLTKDHQDLARSVQVHFEAIANHLLTLLYDRTGSSVLALAGGCAHNSVWVGKIPGATPFKKVTTAPACHDAGIALGAARLARGTGIRTNGEHWALLGPNGSDFEQFSGATHDGYDREFGDDDELIKFLVKVLREGAIIGLYHGRLEFGPRALGSRSIIVDPTKHGMKDKLNARVKHREAFRPFAASVLYEEQDKWLEGSFYSPYMEAVFRVREEKRNEIPAVVHADQTCRIQSVELSKQPFYYRLIEAFAAATGVPMLLNTSFNDSEPIVCSPSDAHRCFLGCEMDHLVVDRQLFSKDRLRLSQAV